MNSQSATPKQNSHHQQRNVRPNKRKGSDSSVPDEEKTKEEKYDCMGQGGKSILMMIGELLFLKIVLN